MINTFSVIGETPFCFSRRFFVARHPVPGGGAPQREMAVFMDVPLNEPVITLVD